MGRHKCVKCGHQEPKSGKLTIYIEHDEDLESPCEHGDGNWTLYSFSSRHASYKHPESLGLSLERDEDGNAIIEDEELRKKIDTGLAFFLSYFEHGNCVWSLKGSGPQDRWDSVSMAGLLVWENDPDDMGAKTYEARAKDAEGFLETYTAWANGECYGYRIEDEDGEIEDGSCWGYYGNDLDYMFSCIRDALPKGTKDEDITFAGDGEGLVTYHWKGVNPKAAKTKK